MDYTMGEKVDLDGLREMMKLDDAIAPAYIQKDAQVLVQGRDKDGNPVFLSFPADVAAMALTDLVKSDQDTVGVVVDHRQVVTLADMAISVAMAINEQGIPGKLKPGSFSDGLATGDMKGAWDRHAVRDDTPAANVRSFDGRYL